MSKYFKAVIDVWTPSEDSKLVVTTAAENEAEAYNTFYEMGKNWSGDNSGTKPDDEGYYPQGDNTWTKFDAYSLEEISELEANLLDAENEA